MKLTGKCKKDFERWYKQNGNSNYVNYGMFLNMPIRFKWGVYVDFFDSVEDKTENRILGKVSRGWKHYYFELKGNLHRYDTRNEARTAAIEKANEIYNSNELQN